MLCSNARRAVQEQSKIAAALLYIARLSFLIVLAGIALTVIGRRGLSVFSFPAGYLLFALPLPTLVYLPLSARRKWFLASWPENPSIYWACQRSGKGT